MINFEKWKDEIAAICGAGYDVAVVNGKPVSCETIQGCKKCELGGSENCDYQLLKWAASEYEEPAPKLTKRERKFLECFTHPAYKKIFRNDYGLYVAACEPGNGLSISNDMFPFIEPGKAWTLEDLLKLEVEE